MGLWWGENFWLRLTTTSAQCLRLSELLVSFVLVSLFWSAQRDRLRKLTLSVTYIVLHVCKVTSVYLLTVFSCVMFLHCVNVNIHIYFCHYCYPCTILYRPILVRGNAYLGHSEVPLAVYWRGGVGKLRHCSEHAAAAAVCGNWKAAQRTVANTTGSER